MSVSSVPSVRGLDGAGGPPQFARPWSQRWLATKLLRAYNRLRRMLLKSSPAKVAHFEGLREIQKIASVPNDINEHLELIFAETLAVQPTLIVEMGVRGGTTTLVFEKVAELCQASVVSVDLDDCSSVSSSSKWYFFRGDDVRFAGDFKKFCAERNIPNAVDVLYIDTSHYYEHTVQEIAAWFPLLAPNAKVLFHDTNMQLMGPRKDGCFEVAWDNRRGVIRAIEEYLSIQIDESREWTDYAQGWLIRHYPNCNGLTILQRVDPTSPTENLCRV